MLLDLLRTADLLSRSLAAVLKTKDLPANQYNVLRIRAAVTDGPTNGDGPD